MLNVSGRYLITLILSAVFLAGCKDPDLDVSSLGKKLPAPSLKGTSPFNQDFELQGYARVQGSCDSRVGNVFISFDKQLWHQPPVNPDLTGTALPVGTTNDRDCSDGSFDIYLTKNDLQNIWGIQTGSNGSHVDYLYIKGESLIGDTETLTLVDNNSGTSPGSNNSPAKIILEKTWPRGFAGAGMCDSFRVSVLSAGGYRVATPTAISFSLEGRISGSATSKVQAYTSWQDCASGTPATQSTFTIPANTDGTDVIYKFPETPLNQIFEFRVVQSSALTPDTGYTDVILRDSSAASSYRWLAAEEYIHQIYKGLCYPIKIRAYNYNRTPAYDQFPGSVTLTSADTQVKFYGNSSCATEVSNFAFASYSSEITAYVKYNPSPTDSGTMTDFAITMVGTGTAGSLIYDASPIAMRADLTSKATVSSVDIWGPRDVTRNTCFAFRIVSVNDNGTLIPVSAPTNIILGTQESNVGSFYSDSTCAGTTISNVSIAAQSTSMTVYFKSSSTASGIYHFNLSSSGLSSKARELNVQP
ncbi:hypothetical protein [Bdellovibrio sp. BCCA]|uniref:hypothetical protein n=1 Tax=Bdellovibrio sp. BCCA TaxID=3136281 RepID=UPI0030F0907C